MFGDVVSQGPLGAVYRSSGRFVRVFHRVITPEEIVRIGVVASAYVRLRHPHLLAAGALGVVEAQGKPTLAISSPAYAPLPDLGRIRDHVLAVIAQVAQGLGALHDEGILCLGVRREHVGLVDGLEWGRRVVLCDGENGRHVDRPAPPAITYLGQPWLAPELGTANRADVRCDIYGLGVLLHELVHGGPPSRPGVAAMVSDRGLRHLLERLLAENPAERPSTTADVLDELELVGWQRTPSIEARAHDDPADALELLVLAPGLRQVPLCEGRVDTWRRCRWAGPCELWHYGDRVYVAPGDGVSINGVAFGDGRRIPLTPGDVVVARDTTFVLVGTRSDDALARLRPRAMLPGRATLALSSPPDEPSEKPRPQPPPLPPLPPPRLADLIEFDVGPARPLRPPAPVVGLDTTMPPADEPPPAANRGPRMLGRWQIVEELGAGASAETFRVTDAAGERCVAKVLLAEVAANPALRARFEREVAILGSIRHVAVPRLHDHDLTGERPYLVMEDAGSRSVADRLAFGFTPDEAVAVIRDVLAALAAAHAAGIIHRDVKPANVLLPRSPGGFAKLLDFGVARHCLAGGRRPADELVTGKLVVGTPLYMSPEQLRGEELGPASDIYSAGCVLYELLSGQPPFRGEPSEVIAGHLGGVPPPLGEPASESVGPPTIAAPDVLGPTHLLESEISDALADVVMQMLAKDPSDRPVSCEAVRALLDEALPPPQVEWPSGTHFLDVREIEPGVFEVDTTDATTTVGQLTMIDRGDRRDGPRLRLDALAFLARHPLDGYPYVMELDAVDLGSATARWARFVVAPQPPRLGDVRLTVEQGMAVMLACAGALVRLERAGRRVLAFDRGAMRAIRARLGSPQELLVQLPMPDDSVEAVPRTFDFDSMPRWRLQLFFDLVLGSAEPPAAWPESVRHIAEMLKANTTLVGGDEDALAPLFGTCDGEWQALFERLAAPADPDAVPEVPPFAMPPELVLPEADPSAEGTPEPRAPAPLEPMRGRLEVGGRVGNWRILRLLGTGGIGRVFEAEHAVIRKRAVAKALLEQFASRADILARFIDEARAVNEFHHPNIVDVFDIGQDERGVPFMVMELIDASTLRQRLAHGALRPHDAIEIARQVAAGLAAAHAVGIVHRDIKPDNLVVLDDPVRVKIIDFGIAHVPRASGYATRTNATMGTPAYMAPEQWIDTRATDARSDIYALGVTLYEMLAGSQPFGPAAFEEGIEHFMHLVREQDPEPPRSPFGVVPPALAALVMRMLAKRQVDRPQTCEELIAELDELLPSRAARAEDLLRRIGFEALREDGTTGEGLRRIRGRDRTGPVTIYVAPPQMRAPRSRERIDALRYLQRQRPPLFVSIEAEHSLGAGVLAFVRRDPVPPALVEGVALDPGPALAVTAVVYRALALLRSRGRRFDNFELCQVRAQVDHPDGFACVLVAPMTSNRESLRHVQYASPDQLMGREQDHDVAYAAGTLAYELLAGAPPLAGSLFEVNQRKASEDPPPLVHRNAKLGAFVDGLVARAPMRRERAPADIEAELLGLLAEVAPAWHAAALRVLATAPSLDAIVVERKPTLVRPLAPALANGERIAGWTVLEHVRFGGDAEVYVVSSSTGRGILKLWYSEVDPHSEEWKRFGRGMRECAKRAGFPDVLELDVVVRQRPRAYAVFEEIAGRDWRQLAESRTRTVVQLAARLCATLADAHALLGTVGDVSPTNVLVRDDASIVLLDVAMPGRRRSEIAGYGTPGYVAPEVAGGAAPTAASDVFSAGILVAELALGHRLFPDIVDGLVFPVGGFEPAIETALADVAVRHGAVLADILRVLLAIDPAARPTAQVAGERLRDLARDEPPRLDA